MLHGFCAGGCGSVGAGTEMLAYVPGYLAAEMYKLTSPNYVHRYYVDGSARVSDAYLTRGGSSGWATVLLGSLGAGGRSVFALDVTSPDAFSPSKVLWEFPNADTPDADKLEIGEGIAQPVIARLKAGNKWVAIFGNGYNSQSGQASLFIVDLNTGELLKRIPVGATGSNGLAAPVPVDVDGDRITDYVYAGDLMGNIWRFDLNGTTQSSWTAGLVSGTGTNRTAKPVFKARTGQAVTTRITVGSHPMGGVMLYFGTGRFLGETDRLLPDDPPGLLV
jgi:type IV pilus assembly protein PilY1